MSELTQTVSGMSAVGNLQRIVWKGPALAWCDRCQFRVDGVWPEQASKRAREHTRQSGHPTTMRYEHTTEYRPEKKPPTGQRGRARQMTLSPRAA